MSGDVEVGAQNGEMAARVAALDWAATPLGPIETWPAALRTIAHTLLRSRHPMFLFWGPELVQIYNDAYRPSLGVGKHPGALGQRGRECWPEIWSIIGPQIDSVMSGGGSTWHEDALVPIHRNGRIEEVYWTYGYSPVVDERGAIGGTLVVCTETTSRVIDERRRTLVRACRERLAGAPDSREILAKVADVLHAFPYDVPFFVALARSDAGVRVLASASIAAVDAAALADRIPDDAWVSTPTLHLDRAPTLPPWPEPVETALVTPLWAEDGEQVIAVWGASPRLDLDDRYRDLFALLVRQVVSEHGQVRARRELERAAAEREELLAELQTTTRAKDEFLAMLSHELRNPLSPIVTALALMKLGDADASACVPLIERQVGHLVRLVDDLLDVSRFARGEIELAMRRVALQGIVQAAAETASPLVERGRHELAVDVPADLVVIGDPVRLTQVFANLLTNAAKYTPAGGHISIAAEAVDDMIDVRVRDDGVGIEPEMLDAVFGMFTQSRQDLARAQGGLGLGLTIVKTLAEKHGGSVRAHSEGRGRGAEFVVRLPAAHGPVDTVQVSAPITSGHRPLRILLVDDNEDAAILLAEALERFGHDVRCAHDGPTGYQMATSDPPEVALLDIGLPVMDGWELAARLRAHPLTAAVKLVAVTGYGQPDDRRRAREAGFAAHLVKPISFAVLTNVLRDVAAPD